MSRGRAAFQTLADFAASLLGALVVAVSVGLVVQVIFHPSNAVLLVIVVLSVFLFGWLIARRPALVLGVCIAFFLAGGLTLIVLSNDRTLWDTVKWDTTVVGVGLGSVSLAAATLALLISTNSDKRMKAMANMEFYEKMAVLDGYVVEQGKQDQRSADRVYHDVKGALQLIEYVDPMIAGQLTDRIKEMIGTIDKSSQGGHDKELGARLKQLLEEEGLDSGVEDTTQADTGSQSNQEGDRMDRQMEDYRFVHEQKTHHESMMVQVFIFSVIASVAVVGYGMSNLSAGFAPFVILFAPMAIIIPCAYVIAAARQAIYRLEAYVRVFLESEQNAGYETRSERIRRIREKEKPWLERRVDESFTYFFVTYWLFYVACAALFMWRIEVNESLSDNLGALILVPLSFLASITWFFFAVTSRANRQRFEAEWKRVEQPTD